MVPPGDIGALPIWVGVYLALVLVGAVSGYVFYQRVLRLVRQGKGVARFDRPLVRLMGALVIVLGQSRVLQRVRFGDWAGIGHAIIFWGFLSFSLSYVIFIFGAAAWSHFPERLLTESGVRVYSRYLDIAAAVLLAIALAACKPGDPAPRRARQGNLVGPHLNRPDEMIGHPRHQRDPEQRIERACTHGTTQTELYFFVQVIQRILHCAYRLLDIGELVSRCQVHAQADLVLGQDLLA